MTPTVFIGIDPGGNPSRPGGIAWYRKHTVTAPGNWEHDCHKMPTTRRDIYSLFDELSYQNTCVALIETPKIVRLPEGKFANSRRSVAAQWKHYGELLGILTALDIAHEEITPQRWQKEFGLVFPKTMNLTPTQKKNKHKARAQELFPQIKITHAIADSLLIAEYCKRKHGTLKG